MAEQKEIYPYKECEQYVNLLQENITRMASNSANCKNWLVAIIAGALAVTFAKGDADLYPKIITLLKWITGLFFFLDCLYLGMERSFIKAEKEFVKLCKKPNRNIEDIKKMLMTFSSSINIDENTPNDCQIKARKLGKQLKGALCAIISWSTTPFYGVILYVLFTLD